MGKVTSGLRSHGPSLEYDHIIVDGVSSGHFLSLIQTPAGLSNVVSAGPIRTQSLKIQEILDNPDMVRTYIVTNLEQYSVQESCELEEQIREKIKSPLSIIANKVFPIPDSPGGMSAEAQNFIRVQEELKTFQHVQKQTFTDKNYSVKTIPFFFKRLDLTYFND